MTANGKTKSAVAEPSISTASLKTLTIHRDDRGNVRELWRESWGTPPVKQMVRTWSRAGTLRGMHYHKKQWDVWHFAFGMAIVQLYDPLTGWRTTYPVVDGSSSIIIPPRIAHGFQAITDTILIYGLTEEYDGSDEYGFSATLGWPGAGLWMPGEPLLSPRDKDAPQLSEFLKTL